MASSDANPMAFVSLGIKYATITTIVVIDRMNFIVILIAEITLVKHNTSFHSVLNFLAFINICIINTKQINIWLNYGLAQSKFNQKFYNKKKVQKKFFNFS